MTDCRWHYDKGHRFLVPGCWNRAINGDDAECHCDSAEPELDLLQLEALLHRVKALELQVSALRRQDA